MPDLDIQITGVEKKSTDPVVIEVANKTDQLVTSCVTVEGVTTTLGSMQGGGTAECIFASGLPAAESNVVVAMASGDHADFIRHELKLPTGKYTRFKLEVTKTKCTVTHGINFHWLSGQPVLSPRIVASEDNGAEHSCHWHDLNELDRSAAKHCLVSGPIKSVYVTGTHREQDKDLPIGGGEGITLTIKDGSMAHYHLLRDLTLTKAEIKQIHDTEQAQEEQTARDRAARAEATTNAQAAEAAFAEELSQAQQDGEEQAVAAAEGRRLAAIEAHAAAVTEQATGKTVSAVEAAEARRPPIPAGLDEAELERLAAEMEQAKTQALEAEAAFTKAQQDAQDEGEQMADEAAEARRLAAIASHQNGLADQGCIKAKAPISGPAVMPELTEEERLAHEEALEKLRAQMEAALAAAQESEDAFEKAQLAAQEEGEAGAAEAAKSRRAAAKAAYEAAKAGLAVASPGSTTAGEPDNTEGSSSATDTEADAADDAEAEETEEEAEE